MAVLGGATPNATTSPERALKLISKGRAEFVNDSTIRMVERSKAAVIPSPGEKRSRGPRHTAHFQIVPFEPDSFMGQTFLHYPQAA